MKKRVARRPWTHVWSVVVPHSTTAVMEGKAPNIRVAINRAVAKASRYVAGRLKQPYWAKP